jgi:hypothetical protein
MARASGGTLPTRKWLAAAHSTAHVAEVTMNCPSGVQREVGRLRRTTL